MPAQIITTPTPPAATAASILPLPSVMPPIKSVHVQMMNAVMNHRLSQISQLGHHEEYLSVFASLLMSDTNTACMEDYYDAAGYQLDNTDCDNDRVDKVKRHYISLMYSSVDERLPGQQRLEAVKSVRVASRLLKDILGRMERGEGVEGLMSIDSFDNETTHERDGKRKKRTSDVEDVGVRKKSRTDGVGASGDGHDGQSTACAATEEEHVDRAEQQTQTAVATVPVNQNSLDEGINMTLDKTASRGDSPSSDMSVSISLNNDISASKTDRVINQSSPMSASDMSVSDASNVRASAPAAIAQRIANAQSVANVGQDSSTALSKKPETVTQFPSMETEQPPSNSLDNTASTKTVSANQAECIEKSTSQPVTQPTRTAEKSASVAQEAAAQSSSTVDQYIPLSQAKQSASPTAPAQDNVISTDGNSQAINNITLSQSASHSLSTAPAQDKVISTDGNSQAINNTTQSQSAPRSSSTAPAHDNVISTDGCASDEAASAPKEKVTNNANVNVDSQTQSNQTAETDVEKNLSSALRGADSATFNSDKSKTRWGPSASVSVAALSKANDSGTHAQNNQTAATDKSKTRGGPIASVAAASKTNESGTQTQNKTAATDGEEKAGDADIAAAAASNNGTQTQRNQTVVTDAEKNLPSAVGDGANAGPIASVSASINDNGTTPSAAFTAVSSREQTASIATVAKSNISSGPTSAFEPVSNSQTSATAGTEVTATPALESPQRSHDSTSGQHGNDVIDLTDSPPGSPRPPSPSKESSKSTDAPKSVEPKAHALVKQLPPSPPPITKILRVSPEPFPDPRPFTESRTVSFLADDKFHAPLFSASLFNRAANQYSYDSGFHLDGSGACLEHKYYLEVRERLSTWEPYWRIVGDVGLRSVEASSTGLTWVGTRTTACVASKQDPNVSSCAVLQLNLPEANKELFAGVKWGQYAKPGSSHLRDQYKNGDTRLILRTLPLYRDKKDKKKRADTHIWPKGTLLQLRRGMSETLIRIEQRKQEKHDSSLWKGMSHMLDLTRYADPRQPINLKLCCAEVVENVDSSKGSPMPTKHSLSGSYALCAAVCKYVGPDVLYDQLMGRISGGDILIPMLSERSAKILAMDYVANQTVALVDSDDEGEGKASAGECNSLTFSLVCPTSKTLIETPVRGRNCKHLQCFDLRNYLRINEPVCGGRWRCHACEEFVSVRDLIHCGLFQAMIDKFKDQISAACDKVTLHSDGSYHLNAENKLRYAAKKPAASTSDAEVIDLD